jgi:hypothetical protein
MAAFDHLVFAAARLDEGASYLAERLGVELEGGGRHAAQGTHNRLLGLGPSAYLEVIAIDPEGEKPPFPRWFGLDSPAVRRAIEQRPRLVNWVARTADIEAASRETGGVLGEIRPMARGDLRWRMTFTADGGLIEGGLAPALIQWDTADHPASRLSDRGCRLQALAGGHPDPEAVADMLARLGLTDVLSLERSASGISLQAVIRTPGGQVTLD